MSSGNGRFTDLKGGFVHIELIGIYRPLYNTFSQTDTRGNKDGIGKAGFGIQGERNTACADITSDHTLYSRRDGHLRVIKALVHTVGDCPVVEQRGKDFMHCGNNIIDTPHVEKAFLLSSERSLGQILGGSRGSDRHSSIWSKLCVVLADSLGQYLRQGRLDNPVPNATARFRQLCDVLDIQMCQFLVDTFAQTIVIEKCPVGIGGRRETFGHRNSGRVEPADHLSKRCVLAAYGWDRIDAEFGERDHLGTCHHDPIAPADVLYIQYLPKNSDTEEKDGS